MSSCVPKIFKKPMLFTAGLERKEDFPCKGPLKADEILTFWCLRMARPGFGVEAQVFYDYTCSVISSITMLYCRMYAKATERFWNNHTYSMAKRVYYDHNFDLGWAEYYFPTFPDGNILSWHKVNILVLPELDQETFDSEIKRMVPKLSGRESWPPGPIDSQTIFIVARRPTREQSARARIMGKKGMIKTRRVRNAPNCIAVPIISENPKEAAVKILKWIENFWRKRILRFCERVGAFMWEIVQDSRTFYRTFYYLLNDIDIMEGNRRLYPRLRHMLTAFVGHFRVLNDYIAALAEEAEGAEAAKALVLGVARWVAERVFISPSLFSEVLDGLGRVLAAAVAGQPVNSAARICERLGCSGRHRGEKG